MPCWSHQFANALQKARRHRQKACFALHRLNDDRRDGRRIHLRGESELQLLDAKIDVLVLAHALRRAISIGDGQPHNLGSERAEAALEQPIFAGQAQSQQGPAMIPALETNHGGSPSVFARQFHRIFDSLGSAVRKQGFFGNVPGVTSFNNSASAMYGS